MIPFLEIDIDLDPNLFTVGPFTLTWHGVFSVLGILAAIRMTQWLAGRMDRIESEKIYDAAFWAVVVGLLGARILYLVENYRFFEGARWVHVFYVNEGGISQWGGIFGAMLGIWLWTLRTKVSFWKLLDAVALPALVGLAIGRIGDVINGEHHGTPTDVPWGVRYVNAHTLGQPALIVHPEVAYELLLCVLLVVILLPLLGRIRARVPDGVSGLWFLAFYAIGRFYLSYFRDDQVWYGLRQAQWASLLMVVLAMVFTVFLMRRRAAPAPVPAPVVSVEETRTPQGPNGPRPRAARPKAPAATPRSRAGGGSTGTRRRRPPAASPPDR
jgi:phosphatidylglycerol---prolipoprotein diacylglyceryl transferase